MKHVANGLILVTVIAVSTIAQTPPAQEVDVERIGPQVGDIVPDFSAVDQFGRTQTLKSIMGPNGAMLFLNRSADW
ncbi:MAG: hypothetical protein HY657_02090 [Acidobacteria bacterium]|nr:hypothetical protein [Acidobacteriota bacterium]